MRRTGGTDMTTATSWGATTQDAAATYRCDELMPAAPGRWLRAIDVDAPARVTFRWVCQLRAAPYSYDWLDNRGRRSPRRPLPWCWDLTAGDDVMTIFTLESFEPDRELTVTMKPGSPTVAFGRIALTYRVTPTDRGGRLVSALRTDDPPGPFAATRRRTLAWGDLVMMRKQLRTLAALAEADAADGLSGR